MEGSYCRTCGLISDRTGRYHLATGCVSCYPVKAADGGWVEPWEATEAEGIADAVQHAPCRCQGPGTSVHCHCRSCTGEHYENMLTEATS